MAKGGREQWDILSFCSRGEKGSRFNDLVYSSDG